MAQVLIPPRVQPQTTATITISAKSKRDDEAFDFIDDNPATEDEIFNSLSPAALAETDFKDKEDAGDTSQIEDVPNSEYIQIANKSNTYSLAADPDGGNIYIGAAG